MRLASALLPLAILAAPAAAQDVESARIARMVALYEELCLKAFPDDSAVDALMAARGATPLTPEEVRVTFNDDPGRGWLLQDGDRRIQVMLELPPFHACSVRWRAPNGFGDLAGYRAAIARFKATHPGFVPSEPYRTRIRDIEVSMTGERRVLADGTTDTLMLVEQRPAGESGNSRVSNEASVRFVRQIADPEMGE